MPAIELSRRLWLAAELRAAQAGYEIEPGCRSHLEKFIQDGAKRLVSEGYGHDSDRIGLAEASIVAFVARMVVEARTKKMDALHEPTFFAALKELCPIWPFC